MSDHNQILQCAWGPTNEHSCAHAHAAVALAAACALAVTPARAQGEKENATSLVVLSKTECVDLAPIQEFSTDNRIISCVRNASEMCCEAMDELLGQDSAVHFCTCSSGVLEDVLDEAVPLFAKDIIRTRIEECGLPIAGEERCAGLYDDSGAAYAAASGGRRGSRCRACL